MNFIIISLIVFGTGALIENSPSKIKMEQYDLLEKKGLTIYDGVIMKKEEARIEKKSKSIFDHEHSHLYYDIFNEDPIKQEIAFSKLKTHKGKSTLTEKQRQHISKILDIYERAKKIRDANN